MQYKNTVEFKVWGKYALFTDPLTKLGGEKYTYQIPTYESLKGILSSIYWKPTFVWIVDKVRVMHPIKTQTRSAKPIKYTSKDNDLSIYTYLVDVEYQVQAHFEWNYKRPDLIQDRNDDKHYQVALRMIERGGRRDIFLGTRECQGYVEPCRFCDGVGFYDTYPGEISFGLMFHGFDYPDEGTDGQFWARFWEPKMIKGIVEFAPPDSDTMKRKFIRKMAAKPPKTAILDDKCLQ
jgi:CRISPR-associated protein Cas5d